MGHDLGWGASGSDSPPGGQWRENRGIPSINIDSFDHESSLSSNIMIKNPLNRFFDIVSNQCIT